VVRFLLEADRWRTARDVRLMPMGDIGSSARATKQGNIVLKLSAGHTDAVLERPAVGTRAARRDAMKLCRRQFLHLAAGAAALPALSRLARAEAQAFPARPVRVSTHSAPGGSPVRRGAVVGRGLGGGSPPACGCGGGAGCCRPPPGGRGARGRRPPPLPPRPTAIRSTCPPRRPSSRCRGCKPTCRSKCRAI